LQLGISKGCSHGLQLPIMWYLLGDHHTVNMRHQ
jgi:hypothetical protein